MNSANKVADIFGAAGLGSYMLVFFLLFLKIIVVFVFCSFQYIGKTDHAIALFRKCQCWVTIFRYLENLAACIFI